MKRILLLLIMLTNSPLLAQKKDQQIEIKAIPVQAYGDEPFYVNARASSGLPVRVESSDESIIFVSEGNMLEVIGIGHAVITVKQEGNFEFNPAEPVSQTVVTRGLEFSQIAKYKDSASPISKRHYDSYALPFKDWVAKYNESHDLKQWQLWQIEAKKALNDSASYLKDWKGRGIYFDFKRMRSVLDELRQKNEFDDDILIYIAFLAGDGFFKHYKITIDQWLAMPNWFNPGKRPHPRSQTIRYINNLPKGSQYLRYQLGQMDWWLF
jgi:hypothetical protein